MSGASGRRGAPAAGAPSSQQRRHRTWVSVGHPMPALAALLLSRPSHELHEATTRMMPRLAESRRYTMQPAAVASFERRRRQSFKYERPCHIVFSCKTAEIYPSSVQQHSRMFATVPAGRSIPRLWMGRPTNCWSCTVDFILRRKPARPKPPVCRTHCLRPFALPKNTLSWLCLS